MTDCNETARPKCPHAYYDKVALASMCDFYCTPCRGYRKVCEQRDKALGVQHG